MTEEPLKLGRGTLFLQGLKGSDWIPVGTAQNVELRANIADGLERTIGSVGKFDDAVKTLTESITRATHTIKFTGFEYTLENLLKTGIITVLMYRQWRAIERQRKGEKVFYRRRHRRSMKGK